MNLNLFKIFTARNHNMATPKKVVKKVVKKSEKNGTPVTPQSEIFVTPDGYSIARGDDDFFDAVDWETTPEVRGKVLSVREIELKKPKKGEAKTTRVLSFVDESGIGWSIWEKKQLEPLFNVVQKDTQIIIAHTGTQEIKGRALPMHKFRCLYRNDQTA